MRRAVITGMGIVSCLGNDVDTVAAALRQGRSGVRAMPIYRELGMKSQIAGQIELDPGELIDRKHLRFMSTAAIYGYVAMQQAIDDAGLEAAQISHPRTGIIMGSGGISGEKFVESVDTLRTKGVRRIGPYRVTQIMSSTVSACLATPFHIKGLNISISSACATSAHCIGAALEQIQLGKQDILFAGGAEEEHWSMVSMFDAMGALSTHYNDTPERASRPYDRDRDGFVMSCGGGCFVVEELEHARARGARIYAEIVGYGATSDGYDMVAPSGEGAVRCMRQALETVPGPIDYINTHGTSTPLGDAKEVGAIREVFGADMPPISSTKSLSGHSLGAAGVHEAIYSLLMMRHGFIAASANIDNLDAELADANIVRQRIDGVELERVMSNSFGFGGTNACLVLERYRGA
ncbi:MAG: beta-ketoacyl-ACP synthase I [Pseudomonadota bacterium]